MNIRLFIVCFAFIVLSPRFLLFAQIGMKLSAETGFFSSSGTSISTNSHITFRFDAQGSYKFVDQKNNWNLKLRIRPKFYGSINTTSITKYSAQSDYLRRNKKTTWGLSFVRQFYQYRNPISEINFDILQLQANLSRIINPKLAGMLYAKYFYRDLSSNVRNSLDAVAIGAAIHWSLDRYAKLTFEIYGEQFTIDNSELIGIDKNLLSNTGWRLGPDIGYAYQRKFILRLNYHIYKQQSELDNDIKAEHSLRLLFGKIINQQWSVFILLDTYIRNKPAISDSVYYARYTPLNTESNMYGKIDYKINPQVNLFFKLEYAKDELFLQNIAFSSKQMTMGLEWRR